MSGSRLLVLQVLNGGGRRLSHLDGFRGGMSVHDEDLALVLHDREVRFALLQLVHQTLSSAQQNTP